MEKKFYTDDFEQFLKETADDFRMYPSKRVWNSLYNNLHPGRKWPSLSVCLLLVSSIIFIGLSHKSEITGSGNIVKRDAAPTLIAYQKQDAEVKQTADLSLNTSSPVEKENLQKGNNTIAQNRTFVTSPVINAAAGKSADTRRIIYNKNPITTNHLQVPVNNQVPLNDRINVEEQNDLALNSPVENSGSTKNALISNQSSLSVIEVTGATIEDDNITLKGDKIAVVNDNNSNKQIDKIKKPLLPIAKNNRATVDKEWIEDYAFHNQPAPSLKSKLLYELYITPSIGYRSFNKNVSYDFPARNSVVGNTEPAPSSLDHHSAFNLEVGYNLLYPYTKSVRFKAGVQFNYTNYTIRAYEIGHTTSTNLLLNDPYSGGIELSPRSSHLSTIANESARKLNNYTFQVALPFGADIKIAGRHNFQWFVGATVQPSYTLFGNAFLLSSDRKNYVFDANFLRKWNINAGLETFVSYKTNKGITFNAGPQFRYQFFSTYNKKYSYDEKLHNVGLKIGMIKNF